MTALFFKKKKKNRLKLTSWIKIQKDKQTKNKNLRGKMERSHASGIRFIDLATFLQQKFDNFQMTTLYFFQKKPQFKKSISHWNSQHKLKIRTFEALWSGISSCAPRRSILAPFSHKHLTTSKWPFYLWLIDDKKPKKSQLKQPIV